MIAYRRIVAIAAFLTLIGIGTWWFLSKPTVETAPKSSAAATAVHAKPVPGPPPAEIPEPAPADLASPAKAMATQPSLRLPEPVYTSNDPEAPPSAMAAQLQRAVEVERGEPVLNADGTATRVRILKDDAAKYPFLRVTETFRRRADGRFDPRATATVATADHILVNPVRPLNDDEATTLAASLGGTVRQRSRLTGVMLIALPQVTLTGVPNAVAALAKHPLVRTAEADPVVFAFATFSDDPEFAKLYALQNTGQTVNNVVGTADADMDVTEAWDATTGSTSVLVGVIDTGVDWTHPDLKDNIALNSSEIPGNGIDDDNNGFIDDLRGWDFYDNDSNAMDEHYHGTHVAGTIAASGNNGVGVVGVAWRAGIVPLRFLGPSGSGNVSDAIEALAYANLSGIRVTNNSWGGGEFSQTLQDTITAGANLPGGGTVFIAAAGNDGSSTPMYPAAYPNANVFSIAATDNRDALASFSNFDNGSGWVDVAAPGVNIYSSIPEAGYLFLNGTSMATPQVTGVAALILSITPDLPAIDLIEQIKSTVDPKSGLTGKVTSGGRVNAFRALTEGLTIPWLTVASLGVADGGNANGVVNPGEPATLTASLRNVSTVAATGVTATLSLAESDPLVTLGTTVAMPGDFAQFETKDAVFTLSVAANAPTPHVVNLLLTTTDTAANTRVLPLTFTVYTQSLVTGVVRDVLGAPLTDVTISHTGILPGGTTTASDGSFSVLLVDGSHELTASKPGYTAAGPRVVTVPPGRSGVDFVLPRPNLVVSSSALAATVGVDGRATLELGLSSDGTTPVTYTVREMAYGYAKNGEPGGVPFNWINIKSTGTRVGRETLAPFGFWPFNSGAYPLQMDFPYYENQFRSLRINNLGWLSFTNASRTIVDHPREIPDEERPENMVAFAWVNNKNWPEDGGIYPTDANSMYYQQVDPQTFVLTMNQWALLEDDLITNQVILKRDGSIILQYGPFTGPNGSSAPELVTPRVFTAGMQDAASRRGQCPVYGPARILPTDGTAIRMYPVIGAPWLRTSDLGADIPANGGAHSLGVTFDATGLAPGEYTTTLVLDSNDPDQPAREIPVTLTVAASEPALVWLDDTSDPAVTVGADLALSVQATGDRSGLTAVRFYNGTALLGTGTPAADGIYNFTWTNVPAGAHDLRAEAVFADGRVIATPVRAASGGTGFRVAIDATDFSTSAPALSRNRAIIEPYGLPRFDFNTLAGSMYAPVTATITRSGSTATAIMGPGELFLFGTFDTVTDVATFSGANQPEYNGTKTITYVHDNNQNKYTFPVTGTPASPATGTIVVDDFMKTGVEDGGATLRLSGVGARKFPVSYTITPNTVLEFDFIGRGTANHQKAVFGIGFDTDNSLSANRVFHLWGNRADWGGINTYRTYIEDTLDHTPSHWQRFRIPVGQHFTGPQTYLTFIHSNTLDTGRYEMDSAYRNVRLYEDTNAAVGHEFAWQITDQPGARSGEEIYHTWFNPGPKTMSVTATRSGQTAYASRQVEIHGGGAFSARVNFQPANEALPPDTLPDSGAVFGDRGNSYTYGWNTANSSAKRSNYMILSHVIERDTYIRQATPQVWEMAVPNGTYNFYLLYGFAGTGAEADSNNNLRVEDVQLVNRSLPPNEWRDVSAKVTVTDGRLTLTSLSNSAALCLLEITRLDAALASPAASFTATALAGPAPLEITFDASSSFSNLGPLAAYAWDFGDGQTATGVNSGHTFAAPGLRTVSLTVTDSIGNTATRATAIDVQGDAPAATTLTLTPATAEVPVGGSLAFTAVVKDQYDLPLAPQPAITWQVSGGGSINSSGVFLAGPATGGPHIVTATSGALGDTAEITLVIPAITSLAVTPAAAEVTTGGTQAFSATVFDQFGQPFNPQPAITWQVSGGGSINSSGLFTAGAETGGPFIVTATSGTVSGTAEISIITAPPVPTTLVMSPLNPLVAAGATQAFNAVVNDQLGQPIALQPAITWAVSGGGSISATGILTAGTNLGTFTVTATSSGLQAATGFTVTEIPATSVFAAHFNNGSGSGGDDLAELYNWNGAIGTSGALVTNINNVAVSQGATNTAGVPVVSGQSSSAGFLFAVPATSAGVSLLHSTSLTTSGSFQDNPQTNWFRAGNDALADIKVGEIAQLSVYTRPASTATTMRFALQVGENWFVSTTAFQQSNTTVYEKRVLADLTAPNAWYSGVFISGSALDDDLAGNPTATLNPDDPVTGYGWYADTGAQDATNSRVRIDSFVIHANVQLPPATGYAAWSETSFPLDSTPAERDPAYDSDGDGLTNLLEYALDTDPTAGSTAPPAQVVEQNGNKYLQLQWTRPNDRNDITTLGEVSPDLSPGSWTSDPAEVNVTITPAGEGMETVTLRDLIPLAGQMRRFLRLRIVMNAP